MVASRACLLCLNFDRQVDNSLCSKYLLISITIRSLSVVRVVHLKYDISSAGRCLGMDQSRFSLHICERESSGSALMKVTVDSVERSRAGGFLGKAVVVSNIITSVIGIHIEHAVW